MHQPIILPAHTCPFLAVLPLALCSLCMLLSVSVCTCPFLAALPLAPFVWYCPFLYLSARFLSVSGCVASHDDVANSRTQPLMSGSTQLVGHGVREYGSGVFLENTLKKQPCHMMYRSTSTCTCTVCTRTALPCTALCHAPVLSPRSMHALSACFFQRVRIISCAVMCHVSVKHANRL